jgi:hypothetical protein
MTPTPDHIRRLLGGYATGTLSEAQRKLLFEAALEDQELFDELARDQALKELLEAPGVKQRLLASIESSPRAEWWRHPLPWALGGSALAISAGLMAIVFLTPSGSRPRPSGPTEVAQARPPVTVETPSTPSVTRQEAQPPPRLPNEPKPARPVQPGGAPSPAAPPAPAVQNEPKPAPQAEAVTTGQLAAEQNKTAAGPVGGGGAARDGTAAGFAGGAVSPPSPPPAARALAARAPLPPGRFAFDYSIHDGVLRIIPGADGYLLVRAIVGPLDRLMLPSAHLVRATPAELRVPDGATAILVLFSSRPIQEDSTEDLATRASPRTESAGTVVDPNPSVNSRLEVRIALSGK